jgi:hypothetical protein
MSVLAMRAGGGVMPHAERRGLVSDRRPHDAKSLQFRNGRLVWLTSGLPMLQPLP